MTGIEITIQVLTCSALVGLLGAVGLRLTYGEVKAALARCRFTAILLLNFALIPALAVVIVKAFALEGDVIIAMVLLAAALPPVVPVFAHGSRRSRFRGGADWVSLWLLPCSHRSLSSYEFWQGQMWCGSTSGPA